MTVTLCGYTYPITHPKGYVYEAYLSLKKGINLKEVEKRLGAKLTKVDDEWEYTYEPKH